MKRSTPHFTVSVPLRCPQETIRPTLPPRVLKGRGGLGRAHISRSTRKRSGLGMPDPSEEGFKAVSSDVSCRFAVSGHRSNCTATYKSRNQSREAGTFSRNLTAWKLLSVYLAPQQVLVMEQEVKALLEKGFIEYVPHSNRETGFYSRYFIVPKKDGGLRPIVDLQVLNDSVMQSSSSKC